MKLTALILILVALGTAAFLVFKPAPPAEPARSTAHRDSVFADLRGLAAACGSLPVNREGPPEDLIAKAIGAGAMSGTNWTKVGQHWTHAGRAYEVIATDPASILSLTWPLNGDGPALAFAQGVIRESPLPFSRQDFRPSDIADWTKVK